MLLYILCILLVVSSKCDCSLNLVGSEPLTIKRNQLLTVLPVWGPGYKINVDLRIISFTSDWGSILRFTADAAEGNCCKLGQRIPALWTKKNSNEKLVLFTNIDGDGNRVFEIGNFQHGLWYNFSINQLKQEVTYIVIVSLKLKTQFVFTTTFD